MAKKKSLAKSACPCTSGRSYGACCRPFHEGADAPSAEALMRSRFAAFALGKGAYLWRTLHPTHPLRAREETATVEELSRAKQTLRYRSLDVHDAEEHEHEARVLFTAHVFEKGRAKPFSELSRFRRVEGAWRYLDGLTRPGPLDAALASIAAFDAAATAGGAS